MGMNVEDAPLSHQSRPHEDLDLLATQERHPFTQERPEAGSLEHLILSRVSQAVEQMLSSLGVLDQLQAGVAFLQGIVDAARSALGGLKERASALMGEIGAGVKAMAARAAELAQEVRPLLDFALGLAMAVANPWLLPGFVAGNLFLHVLPECYKEPMWDFVLDVFLKLIEWTPIPTKLNFLGTAFRAGMLTQDLDALGRPHGAGWHRQGLARRRSWLGGPVSSLAFGDHL